MIKEQKMKYLDNYEKLYEELKIKYENIYISKMSPNLPWYFY